MRERISRLFRNRGGAVIAGGVAAVIAVILLIVYLNSYRSSVNSDKAPERVLVATKVIKAGTSGEIIAKTGLYQVTAVQKDQLKLNAITDPAALAERIAVADIFPGQQLTQDDFTTESQTGVAYQLVGRQRAIAIPTDSAHGVGGVVASGNFVDVYMGASDAAGRARHASGLGRIRDHRTRGRRRQLHPPRPDRPGGEVRIRFGQHQDMARVAAPGRGLSHSACDG